MQERVQNTDYIKFVISKIETELLIHPSVIDISKAVFLIKILKSSRNLIRDAYIISKVRELRQLGNYLLFMIKKTETGDINYENLTLNIQTDKGFLLKEFISGFNLISNQSKQLIETPRQNETDDIGESDDKADVQKENKIPSSEEHERKVVITDNIFKVEEVDNELITEEFEEAEQENEEITVHKGNYLELIEIEREEGFDEIAFGIPGEEDEYEETLTEEELSDTGNSSQILEEPAEEIDENRYDFEDAFSLPGEDKNLDDSVNIMSAVTGNETENETGTETDPKEGAPFETNFGNDTGLRCASDENLKLCRIR